MQRSQSLYKYELELLEKSFTIKQQLSSSVV